MKDKELYEKEGEEPEETRRIWFYIGVVALAAAGAAFGLMFTAAGVFALIAAVILCIASLGFFSTQKRRNNFKAVFVFTVIAYIVLSALIILFIGGLIYMKSAE